MFENYTTDSCGQFLFDAKFIVKKKIDINQIKILVVEKNVNWSLKLFSMYYSKA